MITIQKFQVGISKFIETEITSQFTGWQKLTAETAIGLYISQLPGHIENLNKNPVFAGMGIVKDGKIDIDSLYHELSKHFTDPIPVKIPLLGTATFTKENLDTLYQILIEP